MRLRGIAFISMFLLWLIGCGSNGVNIDKMDLAESLMGSKPDSSLLLLEDIKIESLKGDKEKARYALLKSMALDKNYIDTTTFEVLEPAIEYYLKKGNPDDKLRTYYYQGRIYQNRGDDDSAMQSFICGKEYFQSRDTLTMANLLVAQASIQYTTYNFNDYIKNKLEAARLYSSIGRDDYELLSLLSAMDASMLNVDKHLADSIMSVVRKKKHYNSEFDADFMPYLLSYTLRYGDKENLLEILHHYDSVDLHDADINLVIAEAYSELHDPGNAKRFFDSIPSNDRITTSLKYLAVKPDILEMNGDLGGALEAYKDYQAVSDSIHLNIFSHDLLFAEQRHELEKSNLIQLQKRNNIIWIFLCAVLVLIVIVVIVYYRYKIGRNEIERQTLVAENLSHKIKQLEDESEVLKGILESREGLSKPVEDAIKIRVEMLNGLLATHISENASYAKPYGAWKDRLVQDKNEFMDTTRLAFKASHPKFIEYLEQHGLTDSEINYVCLYAIGLNGKEVGEYIQLKRHYHVSSDIRKKLGLDEHSTNIGIYIRKLMKNL